MPIHVGFILDGNRRWAAAQGLPPLEGHRKGYENLKTIARAAFDAGIKYVSAFVFSTENWDRSKEEVDYLMKLLLWVAKNEVKIFDKENIRIRFLGSRERLNSEILQAIDQAEEKTQNNTRATLALCLNYGGWQEITDAVKRIIGSTLSASDITPEVIASNLYEPDIPPVDFAIRTSGEQRISNFMLWRMAYTELYFAKPEWPAFTPNDLKIALQDFAKRQRRFGA